MQNGSNNSPCLLPARTSLTQFSERVNFLFQRGFKLTIAYQRFHQHSNLIIFKKTHVINSRRGSDL